MPLPGPPLSARFQSTRSARSATRTWARGLPALLISIHALREERDPRCRLFHRAIKISIHALREERDLWLGPFLWRIQVISIHALREERDQFVAPRLISNFEFQSTRSARSATKRALDKMVGSGISIHALREERDDPMLWEALKEEISIHALREERDSIPELFSIYTDEFQSTRSARSATCVNSRRDGDSSSISIHALREERDNQQGWADKGGNISIHALREERDVDGVAGAVGQRQFQSTRSARSATSSLDSGSTAPLNFNPRAPRGARRTGHGATKWGKLFQSTRSARSATERRGELTPEEIEFQSTRSARSATCKPYFAPTAS